jgi:CheY-like chemotaxis protein
MPGERTILVVDDNLDICELLQEALEDAGFMVECATSGEAAMRAAERRPTRFAVIDVLMPGMSGLEVAERLWNSGTHVLLMTGGIEQEEAIERSGFPFLRKPFRLKDLLQALAGPGDDRSAGGFACPLVSHGSSATTLMSAVTRAPCRRI